MVLLKEKFLFLEYDYKKIYVMVLSVSMVKEKEQKELITEI